MAKERLSRRDFLRFSAAAGAGAVLAACAPAAAPEVVTVVETVIVEGESVEVTRIVEGETVVETQIVEVPAADERKVIRMWAQGLTPLQRLDTDRWAPPQHMWVTEREYEAAHPDVDIDFIPKLHTG